MALIKCKECGKEISDTVKNCPHCGFKVEIENQKIYKNIIKIIFFIAIILISYCILRQASTDITVSNASKYNNEYDSVIDSTKSYDFCIETGCTNKRTTGSIYCYIHKPTYSYSSSTSFTNKYGTSTTKCSHNGCNNYIASSGDTNCCTIHSNKCENCKKYIDEDAFYCMDCITKSLNR